MRNKNRSKNRSKNVKLKSLKSASETKTVIHVSVDSAETSQGEGYTNILINMLSPYKYP